MAQTSVAILIVHRNEPEALVSCLKHLQEAEKPSSKWPIYVLDDHSSSQYTKELEKIRQNFEVKIVPSEALAGKKNALAWFLPQMKEEFVLQTDADCEVDSDFLIAIEAHLARQEPDVIVARVRMFPTRNWWSRLAALDHMALQLVTFSALNQGKLVMAAGAAMAYRPKDYLRHQELGKAWAGGEDTFFTQAMAKEGAKIVAEPHYGVNTPAPENFKALVRQRIRWGAKSVDYPSLLAKSLAASVALINLGIVLGIILSPFFEINGFLWYFWLYKIGWDAFLLQRFAALYGGSGLLRGYLILALLYPFFIALVILLMPFSSKKKWLAS
ncbi:glycosyltransferase family 2 protein [Croceimicrobium hydrocarbonivorans]|uniref:Glycosyltransferase n=1 Tax=Croceimicrobium hydrocarbonivorans TaxID=2761580 RepID=A0A7H0VBD9_9FLAO|nr:glycosyltransferase [Croceimicrobium hydrocarbonivorans]QNR23037.1 glycosyltransferase [Croceimicrobium hydrocarbonivorans]